MSWQDELRDEFDKWERIFAVLERLEQRRLRALRLHDEWLTSLNTLREICKRPELAPFKARLSPLISFLDPPSEFTKSPLPTEQTFGDKGATDRYIEELLLVRARIHNVLVSQEPKRAARVEAALLHLQRLLAADEVLQGAWKQRWEDNQEPALETLGAVHFLHHNLYGFKARSAGAETDQLVGTALGSEQAIDANEPVRAGTPLVLTEWKKVTSDEDAPVKLKQARIQLEKYPNTAAATLELRRTRFAILVSKVELKGLSTTETLADGSTMRIVNIAINPSNVSKQAKKS